MKGINTILKSSNDINWLINGSFVLNNITATCGKKILKLSEIEGISRKIGAAFYQSGLRKNHMVHFVIPNRWKSEQLI